MLIQKLSNKITKRKAKHAILPLVLLSVVLAGTAFTLAPVFAGFIYVPPPPPPPSPLTITYKPGDFSANEGTIVSITWKASSGYSRSRYSILYKNNVQIDSKGTWSNNVAITYTFTLPSVSSNTYVYYKIRVRDSSGYAEDTVRVTVKNLVYLYFNSRAADISASSGGQVSLTWKATSTFTSGRSSELCEGTTSRAITQTKAEEFPVDTGLFLTKGTWSNGGAITYTFNVPTIGSSYSQSIYYTIKIIDSNRYITDTVKVTILSPIDTDEDDWTNVHESRWGSDPTVDDSNLLDIFNPDSSVINRPADFEPFTSDSRITRLYNTEYIGICSQAGLITSTHEDYNINGFSFYAKFLNNVMHPYYDYLNIKYSFEIRTFDGNDYISDLIFGITEDEDGNAVLTVRDCADIGYISDKTNYIVESDHIYKISFEFHDHAAPDSDLVYISFTDETDGEDDFAVIGPYILSNDIGSGNNFAFIAKANGYENYGPEYVADMQISLGERHYENIDIDNTVINTYHIDGEDITQLDIDNEWSLAISNHFGDVNSQTTYHVGVQTDDFNVYDSLPVSESGTFSKADGEMKIMVAGKSTRYIMDTVGLSLKVYYIKPDCSPIQLSGEDLERLLLDGAYPINHASSPYMGGVDYRDAMQYYEDQIWADKASVKAISVILKGLSLIPKFRKVTRAAGAVLSGVVAFHDHFLITEPDGVKYYEPINYGSNELIAKMETTQADIIANQEFSYTAYFTGMEVFMKRIRDTYSNGGSFSNGDKIVFRVKPIASGPEGTLQSKSIDFEITYDNTSVLAYNQESVTETIGFNIDSTGNDLLTTYNEIFTNAIGLFEREITDFEISYDDILVESTVIASSEYFSKELILNSLIVKN